MTRQPTEQDQALRFERYPTMDIAFGPHCPCWRYVGGPFVYHPAACLCNCHGGRTDG